MGNSICFRPVAAAKLITYGGGTRLLTGKHFAGEIMFQFPDRLICDADAFYIGQPIPSLAIGDQLRGGQTYFLLPLDSFPHSVLSASSLAALSCNRGAAAARFKECPFEYVKRGSEAAGPVLIKVKPEYLVKLIENEEMAAAGQDGTYGAGKGGVCTSPELQKQYDQLVGTKDRMWSPKLETISERRKIRVSPCRILGCTTKM